MGTANAPQEKSNPSVRIRILGKQNVWSDHARRRDGVQVIGVNRYDKIVWENSQDQACRITFERGCLFGHGHNNCSFAIEPNQTRDADVVLAEIGKEFEFSVEFEKDTHADHRATPKIIVNG